MITFSLCLLALITGYFVYGRFLEKTFGHDDVFDESTSPLVLDPTLNY